MSMFGRGRPIRQKDSWVDGVGFFLGLLGIIAGALLGMLIGRHADLGEAGRYILGVGCSGVLFYALLYLWWRFGP